MKRSAFLLALSATTLVGGIAIAQNQPYPESKPQSAKPPMESTTDAQFTLDTNGDGFVDKQEARASSTLAPIFDKADTNKDGKLDAAELSAASQTAKMK
jgi:hypothetical protein